MSVEMSNCHSWPLDVSNKLSGYFISNSVLVTSCVSTGWSIWLWYLYVHWSLFIYRSAIALVFPYIFLSVDCFEWGLIDHIEQQRDHSVHWQFQMGGPSDFGISMFSICTGIFLLVDHFKWALIDDIEWQRVHSVLWQFQMGGPS